MCTQVSPIIPAPLSSHSDWLSPSSILQGSCLIGLVRALLFLWSPRKGPQFNPTLDPSFDSIPFSLTRPIADSLPCVWHASGRAREGRKALADIGGHARWRGIRRKLRAPHAYDCLFSISTEICRASLPSTTMILW